MSCVLLSFDLFLAVPKKWSKRVQNDYEMMQNVGTLSTNSFENQRSIIEIPAEKLPDRTKKLQNTPENVYDDLLPIDDNRLTVKVGTGCDVSINGSEDGNTSVHSLLPHEAETGEFADGSYAQKPNSADELYPIDGSINRLYDPTPGKSEPFLEEKDMESKADCPSHSSEVFGEFPEKLNLQPREEPQLEGTLPSSSSEGKRDSDFNFIDTDASTTEELRQDDNPQDRNYAEELDVLSSGAVTDQTLNRSDEQTNQGGEEEFAKFNPEINLSDASCVTEGQLADEAFDISKSSPSSNITSKVGSLQSVSPFKLPSDLEIWRLNVSGFPNGFHIM